MSDPQKILEEATALSVEARAQVVDGLLKTLHQPDAAIDVQWAQEATRRLADLKNDRETGIPVEEVMEKARRRLAR